MYPVLLFFHFVGLALGVGTSFANLTLGLATRDLPPEERTKFFLRAGALGKNGSAGLTLLLVTGIGMVLIRGVHETFVWGGGAFHAKLGLVAILVGVFGYLQVLGKQARLAAGGPAMARIPMVGRILLLLSIAIIALAVAAFK